MDYIEADFVLFAEADFSLLMPFVDANGDPIDFTGTTFELRVAPSEGASSVHVFTVGNGGMVMTDLDEGQITFVYDRGDLDPGEYFYQLIWLNGGAQYVYMFGDMTVREGIA